MVEMWKKLIIIFLLTATICSSAAKSVQKNLLRDERIPVYEITSYDYDIQGKTAVGARRPVRQKANPTNPPSQGIFASYLNNLLRNVRLPIPSITWNMTNPLATIFAEGASSLIETPVVVDYEDVAADDIEKQRRKTPSTSRKRKNSNKKSKKRHKIQVEEEDDDEVPTPAIADDAEQEIVLQPYPLGVHPAQAMYFYDAKADQYYEVQRSSPIYKKTKYKKGNHHDGASSLYHKLEEEDVQQDEEIEQDDAVENDFIQTESESNTNKEHEVVTNKGERFVNGTDKRLEEENDMPDIEDIAEYAPRDVIGVHKEKNILAQKEQHATTMTKTSKEKRPRLKYYFLNF